MPFFLKRRSGSFAGDATTWSGAHQNPSIPPSDLTLFISICNNLPLAQRDKHALAALVRPIQPYLRLPFTACAGRQHEGVPKVAPGEPERISRAPARESTDV